MSLKHTLLLLATAFIAAAQTAGNAIVVNLDTAHWTHEQGSLAGSEGAMIRVDPVSGAMDLLVRFPPGHVIAPHFHDSNERIFVAEGQLTLRKESADVVLKTGGFAFLPAGEVQRLSCSSTTRCSFYLSWDGKPNSHPAK